jgi:hypothetical protein
MKKNKKAARTILDRTTFNGTIFSKDDSLGKLEDGARARAPK